MVETFICGSLGMAHRMHFHKPLPPNPKKDSAGGAKQTPPTEHPPESDMNSIHRAERRSFRIASLKQLLVTLRRERQLFRGVDLVVGHFLEQTFIR